MAMEKGQGGIQMLLAAEQEAQHIIASARSGTDLRTCSKSMFVCFAPVNIVLAESIAMDFLSERDQILWLKCTLAKTARLKQAKEEAEREVAAYRAQRESEFRKKLSESSGVSGSNISRLEAETHEKIKHLSKDASKVSPEVVGLLLKYVTSVRN